MIEMIHSMMFRMSTMVEIEARRIVVTRFIPANKPILKTDLDQEKTTSIWPRTQVKRII